MCCGKDLFCLSWEGIQEDFQEEAVFEPYLERSGEAGSGWLVVGWIY